VDFLIGYKGDSYMDCGYFYCPYPDLPIPAYHREKIPYNVGDVVVVQGLAEEESNISWRAKITNFSYEGSKYLFEVTAIDEPPHYRQKEGCIVSEGEIRKDKNACV